MPAPTTYTESDLIAFMEVELGPTGVALGLLATDALLQAVYAVQRLLGLDDVADATDMSVLEAAARWQAWAAAEAAAISQPAKLKSDGDEIDYSQRLAGIRERLSAERSAYYTAVSVAAGSSGVGFVFATIPGCRGR